MHFRQKIFCSLLTLIGASNNVNAQSGCKDPFANNYNIHAPKSDGSCTYDTSRYNPKTKCTLPSAAVESSGLVWTDGGLWTHNDSGNPNFIMKIDTANGAILKIVYIDNFANIDWEDITADHDFMYIAETGNNKGSRKDLKILKIAKANITSADTVHLNAEAINIDYADQVNFIPNKQHNFDCESILSIGDSLYLFSKDRGDFRTRVYSVCKSPGTYTLEPSCSYDVRGLVCAAAYNETTNEVVLLGYNGKGKSFLWCLTDFKNHDFFSGNKRRVELEHNSDWQTEGITYINAEHLFMSTESISNLPAAIFVVDKNWDKTSSQKKK